MNYYLLKYSRLAIILLGVVLVFSWMNDITRELDIVLAIVCFIAAAIIKKVGMAGRR